MFDLLSLPMSMNALFPLLIKETKEAKNKATKKAADESKGEKKSLVSQNNKTDETREGSAKPRGDGSFS